MLQMHNVNTTNILAICIIAYHFAGVNYTHVLYIMCTLFVAVDEAGSPSIVWHISMGLSLSLEKLSFIVPNVTSRACLYTIPSQMNYECKSHTLHIHYL